MMVEAEPRGGAVSAGKIGDEVRRLNDSIASGSHSVASE